MTESAAPEVPSLQERPKLRDDIVIIVDQEEDRERVSRVVEASGYKAFAVRDSRKALSTIDAQKLSWLPEAIVLDLVLNISNGYELLRTLKRRFLTKRVPLVIVSSMMTQEDIVEAQAAGANAFVGKPFTEGDIEEALAHALHAVRRPRSEREPGTMQQIFCKAPQVGESGSVS
ncbi:response regulator [bacterium]|nr:response regulator [bacterium]